MDFPIDNYPTNVETDPSFLYRSLGSFWTDIFLDKDILKGYTIGLAEEAIQRYYDLIEVINSYAIEEIDTFHTEKWKPYILLKSKFDTSPLVFQQNDAVFGPQPSSDPFYQGAVFQLGKPKIPVADVFIYNIGEELQEFGVMTDRVIAPSKVYTYGSEVVINGGNLLFNTNIFEDTGITQIPLVGENGEPITYVDNQGITQQDSFIILWAYHAKLDENTLYDSFGYLFSLNRNNDDFFKDLLGALFDLYIDGPTIKSIKSLCSTFLNLRTIRHDGELIEEIFSDSENYYVITDQEVYKIPLAYTLADNVKVGAVLQIGDTLTTVIEYYDNVNNPPFKNFSEGQNWWTKQHIIGSKLALSQYLFVGTYQQQLLFKNDLDLITIDAEGNINFPVEGTASDIAQFQSYLNNIDNKSLIMSTLGLKNPGDSIPVNPVDFILSNFLKNNCALLKLRFTSIDLQSNFLSLLPYLKEMLPPYVYLILDLELSVTSEIYSNLNFCVPIVFNSGTQILNADGSNTNGLIESLDPFGYKDPKNRLFSISASVPIQPYEIIGTTDAASNQSAAISAGRFMYMRDGKPMKQPPTGATSSTFNNLLLLDFT